MGTIFVILKALREGQLAKEAAKDTLLQLISKGFRIDPKLTARILREIEAFKP